jgi:hypothetical protein
MCCARELHNCPRTRSSRRGRERDAAGGEAHPDSEEGCCSVGSLCKGAACGVGCSSLALALSAQRGERGSSSSGIGGWQLPGGCPGTGRAGEGGQWRSKPALDLFARARHHDRDMDACTAGRMMRIFYNRYGLYRSDAESPLHEIVDSLQKNGYEYFVSWGNRTTHILASSNFVFCK